MKTLLKILSILLIIGAVISIILGIIGIAGGSAVIGSTIDSDAIEGVSAAALGSVALVLGVVAIVSALFNLLAGIFGWKGANGSRGKLRAALVMGWIALTVSVVNIVTAYSQHADVMKELPGLILPLLFVISATCAQEPRR